MTGVRFIGSVRNFLWRTQPPTAYHHARYSWWNCSFFLPQTDFGALPRGNSRGPYAVQQIQSISAKGLGANRSRSMPANWFVRANPQSRRVPQFGYAPI